ncbi:hypothetical protein [Breznakia pachnodae]|uniref:DUF262 domain-containing protein n=1 Tax=Breznakia pachnodae TaxID=265178 RepID=A0ABU0E5V8_9FIRM|nr:hypothetical protein [Breznakia pachnodae]MDQ0362175.1 hypothetical protein [Breznakia pachnodae]
MFKILHKSRDSVINSSYLVIVTNYQFAIDNLVPLIDKLDFQRNPLRKSFYERLEEDISRGCIMPFLTLAIHETEDEYMGKNYNEETIIEKMKDGFVLDGIQRLHTLQRAKESKDGINPNHPLYFNLLICDSMDKLLYRMITLNNGQKPMSARHQIEVLARNIFDFEKLSILPITEKDAKSNRKKDEDVINKDNIIKAYIAYISNSINIDNQKIISSKMDELLTDQIMDSNITERDSQFYDVIEFIKKCFQREDLKNWFLIANNFIGFSAAMSTSFDFLKKENIVDLENNLKIFENAFSSIDVSKIKLGLARRKMVKYYFENYRKLSRITSNQLLDIISMEI